MEARVCKLVLQKMNSVFTLIKTAVISVLILTVSQFCSSVICHSGPKYKVLSHSLAHTPMLEAAKKGANLPFRRKTT